LFHISFSFTVLVLETFSETKLFLFGLLRYFTTTPLRTVFFPRRAEITCHSVQWIKSLRTTKNLAEVTQAEYENPSLHCFIITLQLTACKTRVAHCPKLPNFFACHTKIRQIFLSENALMLVSKIAVFNDAPVRSAVAITPQTFIPGACFEYKPTQWLPD
jgi:hypothetical protein